MIGGPSSGRACGPGSSGGVRCDWVPAAYACPRRSFSGPPLFSRSHTGAPQSARPRSGTGELLRELETISVGVEHVHEPHLPVKLDDDTHVHAGAAELL